MNNEMKNSMKKAKNVEIFLRKCVAQFLYDFEMRAERFCAI